MGASVITLVVVFVLELIAFGLGIGAEQRRSVGKPNSTQEWCVYSSDIATGLGTGALLFLLAGQAIITAATRCLCCGGSLKPGPSRAFAIIFFILNWLSFVVAAACFLAGSVQNAKHTQYITREGDLTCQSIRKSTFAAGVAFTFLTFVLSALYYLCYGKAREGSWRTVHRPDTGVNMATF